MNIFKKYVEKQVNKKLNLYYVCLSDGKSHNLTTDIFFKFENDKIEMLCPVCKMKLTFKLNHFIIDQSTKRSKSMHFSQKIV